MKEPLPIKITGHYGSHTISALKCSANVYQLILRKDSFVRYGYPEGEAEADAGFAFVDPSGGPFIALGVVAKDYHPKLPDRAIEKLELKDRKTFMHLAPKKL